MSTPVHILYHAHCADGFGAALVAWMVFGDSAHFHAVQYGEPLPEIEDGARVFIVDFSYPRPVLDALAARMTLTVLDHHKTAAEALAGFRHGFFDLTKSGAVLAWEHFRNHWPEVIFGPVPKLLLYVQDRDLWQWELPDSRAVNAGLYARPRTFVEWLTLIGYGTGGIAQLRVEGEIVLRVSAQMVESIVKRARWELWTGDDGGAIGIPVVNTPVLQSETCHRLLELHPEAPWCAAYFDQPGLDDPGSIERVWSLRSRGTVDVSAIAKRHGGGGHHNAAGYTELLFPEANNESLSEGVPA